MFAVIYIPDFSLQTVLRHEENQGGALALVHENSAQSLVWQVSPGARKFGVMPGMTSSQAKGRCDRITFRIRSIPQEEAAQEILLECAYLSAAYIESTEAGVCTVDLRGLPLLKVEPLSAALNIWSDQLRARLAGFNLDAQIGVAATPALALQAARGAEGWRFVSDQAEFRDQLNIRALSAAPELLTVLSKWGIQTVGQLLALGRANIAERLGAEGLALFEQAKADKVRPLRLTSPRGTYDEFYPFEQMVETLEPLLFIVRRLLEQLARRVEQSCLSIAEMELKLHLESGEVHQQTLKIAEPSREPDVLFRIAHNYLETIRTGSPIVALGLRVIPCETQTQQFQLFETSVRDANRFYETIGRLGALLGADRVGTPVLRDSHRPDDFTMVAPSHKIGVELAQSGIESLRRPLRRGPGLRRFRPPLPATVRLDEGAPIFLDSSGPSGAIARSQGPWRVSGQWWENLWSREEWDVEMKKGGIYCIFLENNQWFVEGAYD